MEYYKAQHDQANVGNDGDNSWLDWIGRQLWFLYPPTPQEQLKKRVGELQNVLRVLDSDVRTKEREIDKCRKRIKSFERRGQAEECRSAALDYERARVRYRRAVKQKYNLVSVVDKLDQQAVSSETDRAFMALCSVMRVRSRTMHPQRFQAMMSKYKELSQLDRDMDNAFSEFWREEDDKELEDSEESFNTVDTAVVSKVFEDLDVKLPPTGSTQPAVSLSSASHSGKGSGNTSGLPRRGDDNGHTATTTVEPTHEDVIRQLRQINVPK